MPLGVPMNKTLYPLTSAMLSIGLTQKDRNIVDREV